MLMTSLPVGGTITRIACGITIRRSVLPWLMPSACEASVWPSSTDEQAGAADLRHVRGLVQAQAQQRRQQRRHEVDQ